MSTLEGRCLCGAVIVTVTGAHDPRIGACHCRMCQRWSGGLFMCFNADENAVNTSGPVVRHASSSFSERAFCGTCGSHLWMFTPSENAVYDLMPGLFDAAADWPLRSEIYIDRAMTSARLTGDHLRKTQAEYESSNPFVQGDQP